MRCDDCGKFVSFEEAEPEIDVLEVDGNTVTCSVRIENTCSECGKGLTEATLDLEATYELPEEHEGDDHELEVEEAGCERVSRQGYFHKGVFKSQGGRYGKMFYGAAVTARVTCSCGKFETDVNMEDYVQASGMDSMI